jgi:hypothetical protein
MISATSYPRRMYERTKMIKHVVVMGSQDGSNPVEIQYPMPVEDNPIIVIRETLYKCIQIGFVDLPEVYIPPVPTEEEETDDE